jgi:hypothetical protein
MHGGVKSAGIAFVLGLASGLWAQSATPAIYGRASGTVANPTVADDQQDSANPAADNADSSRNAAEANDNSGIARSLARRFQVHGTFSQGFIYGSGNNYLSMETNKGSAKWSEGSINVRTALADNLHAGAQLHSYFLGELGRGNAQLDWAFADYRAKQWMGFRGGKLKAPLGLFGEVEDTDTLYNWALLPQPMYEAEYRSFNVPVMGGEIYVTVSHARNRFTLQMFGGRRNVAGNDGSPALAWQLYSIELGSYSGYAYGANLKWETPVRGLTGGLFFDRSRTLAPHAYWPVNPYGVPLYLKIDSAIAREIYSLRYQRGKLDLAAEGKHEPHWVANNGVPVLPGGSPRNAWYVMGAYHVTAKLTAGSYFSRVWGTSFVETFRWPAYDPSKPEFYSNDTVVNARFDINRFFYLKLEGHYIDGHLGAFFPTTNPNGLQKVTRLGIARIGFTF